MSPGTYDGPGEEDGPWAEGYAGRAGLQERRLWRQPRVDEPKGDDPLGNAHWSLFLLIYGGLIAFAFYGVLMLIRGLHNG